MMELPEPLATNLDPAAFRNGVPPSRSSGLSPCSLDSVVEPQSRPGLRWPSHPLRDSHAVRRGPTDTADPVGSTPPFPSRRAERAGRLEIRQLPRHLSHFDSHLRQPFVALRLQNPKVFAHATRCDSASFCGVTDAAKEEAHLNFALWASDI